MLKLKVWNFWGLIPKFVEVTGEKLVGEGGGEGGFLHTPTNNTKSQVCYWLISLKTNRVSIAQKELRKVWIK